MKFSTTSNSDNPRGNKCFLCHDRSLFQADGQAKLLYIQALEKRDTSCCKPFSVRDVRAASSAKSNMNECCFNFGLGTRTGNIIKLAIRPGVDVNALDAIIKSILEEHGKDAKER